MSNEQAKLEEVSRILADALLVPEADEVRETRDAIAWAWAAERVIRIVREKAAGALGRKDADLGAVYLVNELVYAYKDSENLRRQARDTLGAIRETVERALGYGDEATTVGWSTADLVDDLATRYGAGDQVEAPRFPVRIEFCARVLLDRDTEGVELLAGETVMVDTTFPVPPVVGLEFMVRTEMGTRQFRVDHVVIMDDGQARAVVFEDLRLTDADDEDLAEARAGVAGFVQFIHGWEVYSCPI